MQTQLPESFLATADGRAADDILRRCVHCGFCTAVCPTYRLLGNELDSPRGRIYLIKSLLEEDEAGEATRTHLDRCLGCRACETACPSEVDYHRLLDIGRDRLLAQRPRGLWGRLSRRLLLAVVPYRRRMASLVRTGQLFRPLLPPSLARQVPGDRAPQARNTRSGHAGKVVVLRGCAQEPVAPGTHPALVRLLDRAGHGVEFVDGCCGAVHQHTDAPAAARRVAIDNLARWRPLLDADPERRLVIAATGCASHVRDYAWLLRDDAEHSETATAVLRRLADPSELLTEAVVAEMLGDRKSGSAGRAVFHTPCSMRHGLRLTGVIEKLLMRAGYELAADPEPGLCCGSAGTYSLLRPALASRLREQRLRLLEANEPAIVVTANVGCQHFLQAGTDRPVMHWLEAIERVLD